VKAADIIAIYVLIMIVVIAGDHINTWVDNSRAQKAGGTPIVMTTEKLREDRKSQWTHIIDIFKDDYGMTN
jgi:hypothetical protein